MIRELEDNTSFHSDNKLFKKYFTERENNSFEKEKIIKLTNLLLNFYQKVYDKEINNITYGMFDDDFSGYGYLENYGYYIIIYDGGNYYHILNFHESINNIFIFLVKNIISKKSESFFKENRKNNKKDFKTRFNNFKYTDSLYQYEYQLAKWSKYYDEMLPNHIIDLYTDLINNNFELRSKHIHLEYDTTTKKFVNSQKSKIKKRSL